MGKLTLGRYSHKIAISNHRIKAVSDGKVTFSYKDYVAGGNQKQMTIGCCGVFEAVLFAYFTSGVYENTALRIFSKPGKTKTPEGANDDGNNSSPKGENRLENYHKEQSWIRCRCLSML